MTKQLAIGTALASQTAEACGMEIWDRRSGWRSGARNSARASAALHSPSRASVTRLARIRKVDPMPMN